MMFEFAGSIDTRILKFRKDSSFDTMFSFALPQLAMTFSVARSSQPYFVLWRVGLSLLLQLASLMVRYSYFILTSYYFY